MKNLLLSALLGLILFGSNLLAQTQSVTYQGIAINAAGQRLANQTIALRLSIISESVSGTAVYVETQTKTTNGTGAYTVQVGQGTVVTGTFASINWMANAHFLKVEMDAAGGANYTFVSIGQVTAKATVAVLWQCGGSLTVNHIAGDVAPVNKTVTYGTVTNIPGETTKCLITSNLGADHQATAFDDTSEPSSGWYWQFNRLQGYKHDGTTRTPNTTWISSISENTNWFAANDPCISELGSGWRLPTYTEWYRVIYVGDWNYVDDAWNSLLKLHLAGYLDDSNGTKNNFGNAGEYWSNGQWNSYWGSNVTLNNLDGNCYLDNSHKAYGFSVRCIKD